METKPLNIGITCYPTFGGSGVIATEIGIAMAARGHRVHFICYDMPFRLPRFQERIFYHEVEVRDYPVFNNPPYSLGLASKMVEVTTYENLDLLHVHYAVPHATSAYLARQILGEKAPKIITTLHGTDITLVGQDRSYLPITRFSIIESDGITAPSQYLKNATYDKLNIPTTLPIEVIPNFVDSDRFRPADAGKRPSLSQLLEKCTHGGKTLAHISNFRPVKRVQDVVEIFAKVRREVPSHLILIGDGPERSRIEVLVRERGLEKDVCFLGKQESTVELLQATDVFLLPSESESFGLAALEAQSCGVPVVATNRSGIPEVVVEGETGFLAAVGDIDSMARAAIRLLTNDALRESMGKAARKRVEETYRQERLIDAYESYYQRILTA